MTLGTQLESGDSGKYLINQLVGIADKDIVLSKLDQNTSYDFLGGETPNQALQGLRQQRTSIFQIIQTFNAIYPTMTENEMVNYAERSEIYGEAEAMKWAIQQHPPSNP